MQTSVEAPPAPALSTDASSPAAAYEAYSQQARVLRKQMDGLIEQRSEEISNLRTMSGGDMAGARAVVQERIARLDKRIAGLEEQTAQSDAQVAKAAAVPGSIIPSTNGSANNEDIAGAYFGGVSTVLFALFVWTMIKRRRARKRGISNSAQAALPNELAVRMERLESVAESTALEVERIGEGQRFVTKLLSEQRERLPLRKE